jgi:hypothetical protein
MTEAKWLTATSPKAMLGFLRGKVSDRKLRLLACAIVRSAPFADDKRSMWELVKTYNWFEQKGWRYEVGADGQVVQTEELLSVSCHTAVDIAELYADTPGMEPILATAAFATFAARYYAEADVLGQDPARKPGSEFRYRIAQCVERTTWSGDLFRWIFPRLNYLDQPVSQDFLPAVGLLVRDIFGNPFRPVAVAPVWLTSDVLTLATGIYEDRAFDRMPILADALQDGGCDNDDILDHCRQPGEHVRGCWVVDLVLGKK